MSRRPTARSDVGQEESAVEDGLHRLASARGESRSFRRMVTEMSIKSLSKSGRAPAGRGRLAARNKEALRQSKVAALAAMEVVCRQIAATTRSRKTRRRNPLTSLRGQSPDEHPVAFKVAQGISRVPVAGLIEALSCWKARGSLENLHSWQQGWVAVETIGGSLWTYGPAAVAAAGLLTGLSAYVHVVVRADGSVSDAHTLAVPHREAPSFLQLDPAPTVRRIAVKDEAPTPQRVPIHHLIRKSPDLAKFLLERGSVDPFSLDVRLDIASQAVSVFRPDLRGSLYRAVSSSWDPAPKVDLTLEQIFAKSPALADFLAHHGAINTSFRIEFSAAMRAVQLHALDAIGMMRDLVDLALQE